MAKSSKIVASIALYGSQKFGYGYLAHVEPYVPDTKMIGDGEPHPAWNATMCVWIALESLKNAGVAKGLVRVFASGGKMMADVEIGQSWPWFGSMTWVPATVYVISAEAIEAAATAQVTA